MSVLSSDQMREFASLGAKARLAEIVDEANSILRAFPAMAQEFGQAVLRGQGSVNQPRPRPAKVRRRRSRMSTAARRAVSIRMKKYWADRRKAAA